MAAPWPILHATGCAYHVPAQRRVGTKELAGCHRPPTPEPVPHTRSYRLSFIAVGQVVAQVPEAPGRRADLVNRPSTRSSTHPQLSHAAHQPTPSTRLARLSARPCREADTVRSLRSFDQDSGVRIRGTFTRESDDNAAVRERTPRSVAARCQAGSSAEYVLPGQYAHSSKSSTRPSSANRRTHRSRYSWCTGSP